jgi:hypothetical protein
MSKDMPGISGQPEKTSGAGHHGGAASLETACK